MFTPSNPLGLDYGGLNFAETTKRDEQAQQNQREYLNLKRAVAQHTLTTELNESLRRIIDVPDCDTIFNDGSNSSDTASPASDAFGPVKIIRSMQKAKNVEKWRNELAHRQDAIAHRIEEEIEIEEANRQPEPPNEFLEFELMAKDLRGIDEKLKISSDGRELVNPGPKCRPTRCYPQRLHEFECQQQKMGKRTRTVNEQLQVIAEHYANDSPMRERWEKIIAEDTFGSDGPMSSSRCSAGDYRDRKQFGLNVGSCANRFMLEGFRNPIRTDLDPERPGKQQPVESDCMTRGKWMAELAPKRLKQLRRSRSIDRIDAMLLAESRPTEANQEEPRSPLQKVEKVRFSSHMVESRRKSIASYFNGNIDQLDECNQLSEQIEMDQQFPKIRNYEEDEFFPQNLCDAKIEFTQKFKIRHHHRHKNPTQHKRTSILYQPRSARESSPYDMEWNASNVQRVSTEHDGSADGIDRETFRSMLIQRQQSVEACTSSKTDSVCSHYTDGDDDSGSAIDFDDGMERVPLRHFTKSYDPYEVLKRAGVTATRLLDRNESEEAYYKMPYPGQLRDMRKLMSVKVGRPVRRERKSAESAADDECVFDRINRYIHFPRRLDLHKIIYILRERSRLKFVQSIYEYNKEKVRQLRHELAADEMAFEKKIEGIDARDVQLSQQISDAKDRTDYLTKKLMATRDDRQQIESTILACERQMRERTVYHKTIYLLMDKKWRMKHDWLHMTADGMLESVEESIGNRYKRHMRSDTIDDALDVRKFYEERLANKSMAAESAPMNANDFLKALDNALDRQIVETTSAIRELCDRLVANVGSECLNEIIDNSLVDQQIPIEENVAEE